MFARRCIGILRRHWTGEIFPGQKLDRRFLTVGRLIISRDTSDKDRAGNTIISTVSTDRLARIEPEMERVERQLITQVEQLKSGMPDFKSVALAQRVYRRLIA